MMTTSLIPNIKISFIHDAKLNLDEGVNFVASPRCGAINTFLGTIRDTDTLASDNTLRRITAIHYEAYESMATKQIMAIADQVINGPTPTQNDPNTRAYIAVRLGKVPVQDASIIICVSSTNRVSSHKATLELLEKIKSNVAIWKKIIFHDGHEEWAGATKSEASWLQNSETVG